ncbi:MAG: protein-disulfide reductase DsbD domain-containing protein [Mucilaginibacter sp.]
MKKLLFILSALILCITAKAQVEAPVKWSYAAKKLNATEAVVFIKADITTMWHIYGLKVKSDGPKTAFTFAKSKDYQLVGATTQPVPVKKYEPNLKMDITYFEKSVIFQQKIKLKSTDKAIVKGQLEYVACNGSKCLPPEDVNFSIPIAD